MKILKRIIMVLVMFILGSLVYGWYIYNKKPADVRLQTAKLEIKAQDLLMAFQQNESAANMKYVDKVIVVSGKVSLTQINSDGLATIYLETGDPHSNVVCSFYETEAESVKKITPGTYVEVKGNCTGILSDIILNKCSMAE